MANLRAGLIGLGMMGRNHARVLRSLPGVDLVAVADPAGDPHGAVGTQDVLGSVEDLISAGLDYATVALPTAVHHEVGLALAAAGVHALIEKPLAHDSAAAADLVQAFEKAGLIGAVGHIERYNAALRSARERLAAGELGEIYQVATRRQGPFPARIADVGVVKDLATHDVDLTAWLVGQDYTSVTAHTVHRSGREHEDLVAVLGLLQGGAITNHLVNWLSPLKERTVTVTGDRGAFVADTLTADLTFYGNGSAPTAWSSISQFRGASEGDVIRYAIAKPEPLRVEHESFRDAVLGLKTDIVTLAEGLATVRVAEAVLASARTGRTELLTPS